MEWQMNTRSEVFKALASDSLIWILLSGNIPSKRLSEVSGTVITDQSLN
jgi:hypothetical protein